MSTEFARPRDRSPKAEASAAGPAAAAVPPPPTPPPAEEHLEVPDLLGGGLYFSLMRRFGVEPAVAVHAARRAVGVGFLLWIPVVGLALIEGRALPGGKAEVPFFYDVAAYARSLVIVPLLLVARPILAAALRRAGAKFRDRGILAAEARVAAEALAARITRSAQRVLPNAICLVLTLAACARLAALVESEPSDSWFAQTTANGKGSSLTLAGLWSASVGHGVLFYLSLGWLWRLLLWYRFLWGVSRLRLSLLPMHPDRAAGLGFLGKTIAACGPLVLAWGVGLAAPAASLMLHGSATLQSFQPLGIGFAIFVVVMFVLPPVVIFAPSILRARRDALEEWGRRLAHTGEGMRRPALEGAEPSTGLEDLQIAVTAVRGTLPFPFTIADLVALFAAVALPALGLVLLAVPFGEVIDRLLHLLR